MPEGSTTPKAFFFAFMKLFRLEFVEDFSGELTTKEPRAYFKCDCGNVHHYIKYHVISGKTKECKYCRSKTIGNKRKTHGLCDHILFSKWRDFKNRCYNSKSPRFNCYGARGIKVCDEWRNDFTAFYNWSIRAGWSDGLTIERMDVNGDYCPTNCCYITKREQWFNLKNTFYLPFKGFDVPLKKLYNTYVISTKVGTLYHGVRKGIALSYYYEKDETLLNALNKYIENA